MEISVVRIGNSKGIKLDRAILERYGITDKVKLEFKDDFLILKPVKRPREGWEDAFMKMAAQQDDTLLIDDVFEDEKLDS